ncbi:MAG TPA: alpha/beta fold hydrolase [Thermoanaerobaculia bacterium]|nr:alpha/beta fold hydrolase [Thermoanaerobaculia bacterium]
MPDQPASPPSVFRSPAVRFGGALAAGLVLTLTVAAGRAPRSGGGLALSPCHLDGLAEPALCGTLSVPENRDAPGSRKVPIRFAVLPALRAERAPDPLLFFAGGPGQAGRDLAGPAAHFFSEVRRHRDLVFVDLRGTGGSNRLDCPLLPDPLAGLGGDTFFPADVPACRARLGSRFDLGRYAEAEAMADLDQVRSALGVERWNLWGGSWGTRAALLYARAYPSRVRSVVLDGAASLEFRFPLTTPADAQDALDRLLADCAAEPACRAAHPDLGAHLQALFARLAAGPVRAPIRDPISGAPRMVAIWANGFAVALRVALYTGESAAMLPQVIEAAAQGDWGPFAALAAANAGWSSDTMALGATLSTLCAEDVRTISDAEAARAAGEGFVGGGEIASWRRACAEWPPGPPLDRSIRPLSIPALILSGALDPATPPRRGEAMRVAFPNSRHTVFPGAAHNVSFSGCAPELIARFLAWPEPARLDDRCARDFSRSPFYSIPGSSREVGR